MQGGRADHEELRARVVDHIRRERDFFENFVEDDEAFDDYISRMAQARRRSAASHAPGDRSGLKDALTVTCAGREGVGVRGALVRRLVGGCLARLSVMLG